MIVTLTPNPSHDRTVTLGRRLERGAVQRAESVLSQAGGKGVNISRASVAAGIPSIAVLPAPKDDPYVHELLAAGIDCRPVDHHGGALRVNITISEPDGTTTKLNSPGPTATPEVLAALTESLRRRAASRRLGGAGRLAAARRAGRVVRRPGGRAAPAPAPASRSTPATPPCARWSSGCPTAPRT